MRQIEVRRPDGTTIVSHGREEYLQRPFNSHGQPYVHRTYMVGGHLASRVYRAWAYHGHDYYFYAHPCHYRPGFYRWAGAPYPHPYRYSWAWYDQPWYGYYSVYYVPYPAYEGPSSWLADNTLAETFEAEYLAEESQDPLPMEPSTGTNHFGPTGLPMHFSASLGYSYPAQPALLLDQTAASPAATGPMPPKAKQALVNEIKRQLKQSAVADPNSQTTPEIFTDQGPKTFLVANETTVMDQNQEVALKAGTILTLAVAPNPGSEYATVRVLSSLQGPAPGVNLQARVDDLIEMQNHLEASLDHGLEQLQAMPPAKKVKGKSRTASGKDPLPGPSKDVIGSDEGGFTKDVPEDADAARQIAATVKEADLAEQKALAEDQQAEKDAHNPTKVLHYGMTMTAITEALGEPDRVETSFAKKTLYYGEYKVVLVLGRVVSMDKVKPEDNAKPKDDAKPENNAKPEEYTK
jgi:hypothetical protein